MNTRIAPGRLVVSTAGRDSGKFYLILDLAGDNMVWLVNGRDRKLAAPKKKNTRHIKVYPRLAAEVAAKIASGQRVNDQDIRKALTHLLNGPEQNPDPEPGGR
ncbi:KOW domain-containing RNA-binding protein [Desulfotomaculum copahuensis]|uniref:RNA-binding protein n=1 Tax=Desulfotomaculum copahuensis TaxID=1838280 RepID=A0A1B7LDI6_9FIRM|nr:KOW domain-containing RNA-binding protein [Desulfotomaculum copahuensis]OAT81165.1 hypothetical protein A6M21_11525 [Desulfotomaculum copahuensis]